MAELKPHEQRVVAEYKELRERHAKLYAFIASETFITLPEEDRELLVIQENLMDSLGFVLARRIRRFTPTPAPQRKPLTKEQIIDATEHISMEVPGCFIHIARAIEAAHGISAPGVSLADAESKRHQPPMPSPLGEG